MRRFEHERTEIYAAALDLVKDVSDMRGRLPADRLTVAERLERTAIAVVIYVAKATGEPSGRRKVRLCHLARLAAIECAALLDILQALDATPQSGMDDAKNRLRAITSMLRAMSEWADDLAPAAHLQ